MRSLHLKVKESGNPTQLKPQEIPIAIKRRLPRKKINNKGWEKWERRLVRTENNNVGCEK
jgi:hypothetical protein